MLVQQHTEAKLCLCVALLPFNFALCQWKRLIVNPAAESEPSILSLFHMQDLNTQKLITRVEKLCVSTDIVSILNQA